jgi:hypothetical protein
MRARRAAGFVMVSVFLVKESQRAAPLIKSIISIPWRDMGRSPTADVIDVLPPTQSHIGNIDSHLPLEA